MGLKISSGRKARELAPKGNHQARVCFIVDMGTQPGSKKFPDEKRKLKFGFQVLGAQTEDGKNIVIYQEMTLSNSPQAVMMKMLEDGFGITDRDYEIDNLLGEYTNLTIKHEKAKDDPSKVYDKIAAFSELSGKPKQKGDEPLISFYMVAGEKFDRQTFEELPDWIQTKIAGSPEYQLLESGKGKASKKKK